MEATLIGSVSGPEGHGPPAQSRSNKASKTHAQSQSNKASKPHARSPPDTHLPSSAIQTISLGPSASSKSKPDLKPSQTQFASYGPDLKPFQAQFASNGQLPKPSLLLQHDSLQPLLSTSPAHSTSTTKPTVPLVDPLTPLVNIASNFQPTPPIKIISVAASPAASLTRTTSSVRPPPHSPSPSPSASNNSPTHSTTPEPTLPNIHTPKSLTSATPSSSNHPISPHRLPLSSPPLASFTSLLFNSKRVAHQLPMFI